MTILQKINWFLIKISHKFCLDICIQANPLEFSINLDKKIKMIIPFQYTKYSELWKIPLITVEVLNKILNYK